MKEALQCDLKDSACHAAAQGLRYIDHTGKGYTRTLKGDHFIFYDTHGKQIHDAQEIARIRKLAIPPAYRDVWICPQRNGHIQATGIDARGRKQYRYHTEWREVKDASKFHHRYELDGNFVTVDNITKEVLQVGRPDFKR